MKYRIGFGYDIHRLQKGKPLWLGGVLVSEEIGAIGHSDADVLIHAICDALLGAAGLRDIGIQFPDTSKQFKGISSLVLLEKVMGMLSEKGFSLEQVDSTICLQSPKIAIKIPEMRLVLSQAMAIAVEEISVKATTKENLGAIGRGEGIEAYAVVLINKGTEG
jgi:2-C-methyl-D-erythritol 2,4-cyclodiphosphate synthase